MSAWDCRHLHGNGLPFMFLLSMDCPMDWKEKYARIIEFLDDWECDTSLSAILIATIHILRKENIDYSVEILGDFCKFFVSRDKSQLLEQLQRFAENGWFINQKIDHIALLEMFFMIANRSKST